MVWLIAYFVTMAVLAFILIPIIRAVLADEMKKHPGDVLFYLMLGIGFFLVAMVFAPLMLIWFCLARLVAPRKKDVNGRH